MNDRKTALITLSAEGAKLLAPLVAALPETQLFIHESVRDGSVREALEAERFARVADLTAALFPVCRGLVYAAPCGVVVRAIAPLIRNKLEEGYGLWNVSRGLARRRSEDRKSVV